MNEAIDWVELCALDDIEPLSARTVRREGKVDIAVFRGSNNRVFALEDRCPHAGGPLSQGIVHGARVTCPLHAWTIELESGEAVAPDTGCGHVVAVRVVDAHVQIDRQALR